MRNLKFHSIRAENILCFGPKGIELIFENYGNIVQVRGINLDAPGTEDNPASNGAGKSSIQELLSIGLFGRTIKSPTKNKGQKIVNVLATKGEIEIQWDDFRVIRSFKKTKSAVTSSVEIWQSTDRVWNDESKISFSTSDETQKFIEEKIGLSHHAFCNVIIFDDSNTYSFLEADAATKRQVVENLLDLEQYRNYQNNCKELQKEIKKKISDLSKEYSLSQTEVDSCDKRIVDFKNQENNWKCSKQNELKSLMAQIKSKQSELENSDTGSQIVVWQNAQESITKLSDEVCDLESKRDKVVSLIKTTRDKLETIRKERDDINQKIQEDSIALKNAQSELNKANKLIVDLENLKEGTNCPTCKGVIKKINFGHVLDISKEAVDKHRVTIEKKEAEINGLRSTYGEKSKTISSTEDKIQEADEKVSSIEKVIKKHRLEIGELSKITKPEGDVVAKILETEITELKKQFKSKKEEYEGESPYKEIIEKADLEKNQKEQQRDEKAKELEHSESELPYYDFWSEAFGDDGIRKFVIEGIIPALNERIAYWMQILIDGLIELTFDNKLEETITRNGNPAFYHNMSNGEIRRINLAVSQSFSHVMMLNSGSCPNLVFLDEITGGGIDKAGVPYVYNMIVELAKERQVFVTTHNDVLINLLQGCETLTLKKQNDITNLVC